jgi:diguanylate cyclase (GGDEF)-like protein
VKKKALINLIHFSIFPKDDPKQALRIRRFLMAFSAYVICAFFCYFAYFAGVIEREVFFGWITGAIAINITLYIFLRSGLNLKMADPSLTVIQMSAAIIFVMFVMYFANETRPVLLLIYVVILLFGIFRLNTRSFLYISIFALLTYIGVIALLRIYRPEGVNFQMEYLQCVVLGFVMVIFSVVGGYISSLRQNLSISKSEQAKSIEIIREMAIRDVLTSLYNRRHVLELLDHEKNRSSRGGGIFCLAIMDIDHFKNVNDTYGHLVGDAVLQAVANTMKTTMRNTEYCARYGGEEFLIVLTQTNINGALIGAERVRANIEKIPFPDIDSNLKITVSIGLSEYKMREDIEKVIARADEALYRAKNGGRNRVETA